MSFDPFKPVGDKKGNSVFDPVDFSSSTTSTSANNSWGYSTSNSSNQNSWAYSTGNPNANNSNQGSSWAYQTGSSNKSGGHWGHQQGYGFGDHSGFGNDSNLMHLEGQQRKSVWGNCDGSSWHFSNASRDLDVFHAIDSAKRTNESNSVFGRSYGFGSSKSHFASTPSAPSTSSFNPFGSIWDNKKKFG